MLPSVSSVQKNSVSSVLDFHKFSKFLGSVSSALSTCYLCQALSTTSCYLCQTMNGSTIYLCQTIYIC